MNDNMNFAVIALVFYLWINTVSCLKCHVCSSTQSGQADCMAVEKGDSKYLTECAGPSNQSCRVQEQWVDFEVLGQQTTKRVLRQCATTPLDPARPCYYRAGFGGKVNVCNCGVDGCNGASTAAPAILALLGSVLFLKMVM